MKTRTRMLGAPLAGVIAIVLSASAFAADNAANPALPNAGVTAEVKAETAAAVKKEPQEITVDQLVGSRVYSEKSEDVGNINAVILAKEGQVNAVVVGVGGFLGLGEKEVAVPWDRMTLGENGHRIMLSMTKEELENMPAYVYPDNERPRTAFLDPGYEERLGAQSGTVAAPSGVNSQKSADMQASRADAGGRPPADEGWSRAIGADGKIRAASFVGTEIMNSENESIGEIEDVLIAEDGKPQVLVSVGGFLGIGDRDVLLDWDQLSIDRNNDSVRVGVSMNKQQLEELPAYAE